MKIIDDNLINSVVEQAKQSPRLRMNYTFHIVHTSNKQKLLKGNEYDTYCPRIHFHNGITSMVPKSSVIVSDSS